MLILTPNTISEAGGTSTVTARLDRASSADTTVTVRDGIRYKLGANAELTIPAGQTASVGSVTLTAVDNNVHAYDRTVRVSATATNTQGINNPRDAALTITNDDAEPTVTQVFTPETFTEGGESTYRAHLSHPSEARQIVLFRQYAPPGVPFASVWISAYHVYVEPGDTVSPPVRLVFQDNDVDEPNRQFGMMFVAYNVINDYKPTVQEMTFTVLDDDGPPTVTDDHGDSRDQATPVSTTSSTAGDLERAGDVDYFRVGVGQAGQLVVASGGDTDTTGRLENGDGTELAADDDGGDGDNFRIAHHVAAGDYYIAVRGFDDARTGEYSLAVSFTPAPTGEEGELRLADGPESEEQVAGRLEIWLNGQWGTVCDDLWDRKDAEVACRQLGFLPGNHNWGTSGSRPVGTGPIWLDDLRCQGDEARLDECPYTSPHDCTHHEDVWISCSKEVTVGISADDARITEGQAAVFTLSRDGGAASLAATTTVAVLVSEDGDVLSAPPPASVGFEAGATTARLSLPTEDDATGEADSTVTVTVVEGEGYSVGAGRGVASLTVADNDGGVSEPDPNATLDPPTDAVVDRTSRTHLRFNWDAPAGTATRSLIYDVCIQAGTADCTPAAREYARPFQRRGDETWTSHLFGSRRVGADGLTPGTTYRMCVLARRGNEFSPTVCVTGTTSGG